MVCLGLEAWVEGWMAQMKPLSYGGAQLCPIQSLVLSRPRFQ